MYKAVIIDDEPIIVEGLTKGLSWEKNNCIVAGSATNGEEGIKLIRATKPDILITDISMPRLDGLTMIAALKSEFPDMQITILTGYREFDYARKAIELGVTRFLLKPSKFAELEEAIEVMTEKLGAEIDRSGFGLLKDADGADADAFSTDEQGEDLAHFSRVFKKSEGMSANEYRNNLLI